MDRIEIVTSAFSSIEANDFATVEKFIHKDYLLTGAVPNPMGKKEVLTMLKSLKAGFPDLRFNLSGLQEQTGQVHGSFRITGTHTKALELGFLGMPSQPATRIKLQLPDEKMTVSFLGERISDLQVEPVEGGGLVGLLNQIGVALAAPV